MCRLLFFFGLVGLFACENAGSKKAEVPQFTAQEVIDAAIAKQGGTIIQNSTINFDFRDKHYIAKRDGGTFTYERIFTDTSENKIRDVLTNSTFQRFKNEELDSVTEKKADAYSNSINSVIYFALLPYFLNDAAVNKTYLGEVQVKGQTYHKIKVVFEQEGGGKDFEDQYVYWIHKEKLSLDYLAYNYKVDGGGARFREAYGVRKIEGVRFADYINYKPSNGSMEVETFDHLFEHGKLKELSRIDLKNITISSH